MPQQLFWADVENKAFGAPIGLYIGPILLKEDSEGFIKVIFKCSSFKLLLLTNYIEVFLKYKSLWSQMMIFLCKQIEPCFVCKHLPYNALFNIKWILDEHNYCLVTRCLEISGQGKISVVSDRHGSDYEVGL